MVAMHLPTLTGLSIDDRRRVDAQSIPGEEENDSSEVEREVLRSRGSNAGEK